MRGFVEFQNGLALQMSIGHALVGSGCRWNLCLEVPKAVNNNNNREREREREREKGRKKQRGGSKLTQLVCCSVCFDSFMLSKVYALLGTASFADYHLKRQGLDLMMLGGGSVRNLATCFLPLLLNLLLAFV